MSNIQSVCVYCGSSDRAASAFLEAASRLGHLIGSSGRSLVYGGGRLGLMGRVADGTLAAGGNVVGIIPDHLHKVEVQHDDVTELLVVDSMHTRKAEMVRRSDGFVVLPGGIGTLDELIEILSWRQLGLHGKPVVIVDQDGYYAPFRDLMDHIVEANFANPALRGYMSWVDDVDDALTALDAAEAAGIEVRLDKV